MFQYEKTLMKILNKLYCSAASVAFLVKNFECGFYDSGPSNGDHLRIIVFVGQASRRHLMLKKDLHPLELKLFFFVFGKNLSLRSMTKEEQVLWSPHSHQFSPSLKDGRYRV